MATFSPKGGCIKALNPTILAYPLSFTLSLPYFDLWSGNLYHPNPCLFLWWLVPFLYFSSSSITMETDFASLPSCWSNLDSESVDIPTPMWTLHHIVLAMKSICIVLLTIWYSFCGWFYPGTTRCLLHWTLRHFNMLDFELLELSFMSPGKW